MDGTKVTGQIKAINERFVKAELFKNQITPQKIWLEKSLCKPFKRRAKNIADKKISELLCQLTTLIQAGIPILQSLESIKKSSKDINVQQLIQTTILDIQQGHALSYAFKKHPKQFDHFACHLITIGETSGTLDIMLTRIVSHRMKYERFKAKLKKALLYPTITLSVAFLVICIMLIFVIPQFESLFLSVGANLPLFTRLMITTSQLTTKYGWILLALIGLTIFLITHLKRTHPNSKKQIDALLLRTPIIGVLSKKILAARLTRTLATICSAGINITSAIDHAKNLSNNTLFYEAMLTTKKSIQHGKSLHFALQETQLFHNMVIQMIAIGEEAGKLDEMLEKIAEHYESEIDQFLDTFSLLIEPIIMVVLGVIIGGLIIAMYLPIFKLGTVI